MGHLEAPPPELRPPTNEGSRPCLPDIAPSTTLPYGAAQGPAFQAPPHSRLCLVEPFKAPPPKPRPRPRLAIEHLEAPPPALTERGAPGKPAPPGNPLRQRPTLLGPLRLPGLASAVVMTAAVFFGCAFIAFGPALALYVFTIATDPLRVIFLIAG